jgi:hypothetical protein
MITITIEDEEDVYTLFEIMLEMKQWLDCYSGECDHNQERRDDE